MSETNEFRRPRSLFFPLLLVLAGIFLLLTNLGYIQSSPWNIVGTYWPLIFVVGGLDSLYRREGWVGPLVSLGLGTILLLGNLKYLQWGGLDLLLRMWPVLLIAWGLDVAFSRQRSLWSTLTRVAFGLLLVGAILWLAIASPFNTALKTKIISQSLDGATHSTIRFADGAGGFNLSGNADETKLVTGTAGLPANITLNSNYGEPKDGTSSFSLTGSGVVVIPVNSGSPDWNFKLNSLIPIDLSTEMGAGSMVLDLSDVRVETLKSEMGVGRTYITFPAAMNVTGSIKNAVGETVLRFPRGSQVIIHYNTDGLVSEKLPAGFTRADDVISSNFTADHLIEISVESAIGNLVIEQYE